MSLDVIGDVDTASSVAQAWTYYEKLLCQGGCLPRNRQRRRIAVLDEPPCIVFAKPIVNVDLRVRFFKPLIPEIQNAILFVSSLGAIHNARRYIEPVCEFVDEEGSDCCAIRTKSGRRRNLNTKIGAVAPTQHCHPATNQYAVTRPN